LRRGLEGGRDRADPRDPGGHREDALDEGPRGAEEDSHAAQSGALPSMMHDHDFEKLLVDGLGRRGRPAPFPVDVADRVMARVASIGAPSRTEMTPSQFGRWAVAPTAAGIALTAAAAWQAPSVSGSLSNIVHTVSGGTAAALKLAAPVSSLMET